MKISKDARRTARQLMNLTVRTGRIDGDLAKMIVNKIATDKPRHYLGVLTSYARLLRLEQQKRHAVVESATDLSPDDRGKIESQVRGRHGDDVTFAFSTVPALLGGVRIRLGSNVWDGSVKSRIDALSSKLVPGV
jgi:F-type H+-transporting ATPase subunit delta